MENERLLSREQLNPKIFQIISDMQKSTLMPNYALWAGVAAISATISKEIIDSRKYVRTIGSESPLM